MAGDTLESPTWEDITGLAQCHTDSGSLLLLLHKYPFASLKKEPCSLKLWTPCCYVGALPSASSSMSIEMSSLLAAPHPAQTTS